MSADDDAVIRLTDVNVSYRLPRMPTTSFKDFGLRFLRGRLDYREIHALRDVNLVVTRGEVVGVVGPNGAGKSTLTRVLGGILPPASGRAIVRGRVDADPRPRDRTASGADRAGEPRHLRRAARRRTSRSCAGARRRSPNGPG